MKFNVLLACLFLLLFVAESNAQFSTVRDLIVMKNGTELRGTIIEKAGKDSLIFQRTDEGVSTMLNINDIDDIFLERLSSKVVLSGRKPFKYVFKDSTLTGIDVIILETGEEVRGRIEVTPSADSIYIVPIASSQQVAYSRNEIISRKSELSRREPSEYQSKFNIKKKKKTDNSPKLLPRPKEVGLTYIGLSYNFLIPKGNFARTDFGTQFTSNPNRPNELAFAKSGFALGLDGAFMLSPKVPLGVALSLRFQFNGFDSEAFASSYSYYNPSIGTTSDAQSNECTYQSNLVMTGLAYSLRLGERDKIVFDTRLLGGMAFLSLSNALRLKYDRNAPVNIEYRTSSVTTCFGLETGFRFFITPNCALGAKAGYTSADFLDIRTKGGNGGTIMNASKVDAHINNVNIGLSLSYCY